MGILPEIFSRAIDDDDLHADVLIARRRPREGYPEFNPEQARDENADWPKRTPDTFADLGMAAPVNPKQQEKTE